MKSFPTVPFGDLDIGEFFIHELPEGEVVQLQKTEPELASICNRYVGNKHGMEQFYHNAPHAFAPEDQVVKLSIEDDR